MLRKILIPAVFLILPMAMLYPLWRCPTSAGEDDVVYYYPLRVMVAGQVRSGQLPLWNSGEAGGVPLFADPQSAVFFPPNWLFLFLSGKLAYSLCIFGAFAVAGGGAYLYMRRIGLALPAAIFGAVAFEFCGFLIGHRVHLGMIQAAAFLPWGLWAIERIRTRAGTALAWMAPIFALTLAAGHWPTAINLILVWLVYLLVRGRPIRRALAVAVAAAAIGAAVLAPQIIATAGAIGGTIRSGVPYAVAGENSFFPLAGVLAFFPFVMGSRTPNFFPHEWWGPWHLCEMLGYVGLVTLVLAAAAIWRLYRKRDDGPMSGMVKLWTWILIGAGVWALGYYLPTYRLIHMIPVLGSVRCPARMLLVIDFALAVLAAIGIDALVRNSAAGLGRTVRRTAMIFLPACMLGVLGILALAAAVEGRWWSLGPLLTAPAGGAAEAMWTALNPLSPAIYVPLALAAATIAGIWWFTVSPRRRAWALTGLVIIDLLFIARFVDVPACGRPCPDPQFSPAARWLKANAPADEPYRVWGLSRSYHHRPAELLLPKTCAAMGFETISYYGPFQPAEHPRLFGFRSWGENYEWAHLIRRNYLLSLFNVRYILAADPEFRKVVESVRIPADPPPPDGPNLLGDDWTLHRAEQRAGRLHMMAPYVWSPAEATQPVALTAGKVFRIALDACAPDGAGNCIMAEYLPSPGLPSSPRLRRTRRQADLAGSDDPALSLGPQGGLRVDVERLASQWGHFEWTFVAPAWATASEGVFRIHTTSDRPIEVRNVSLRRSSRPAPINLRGRLSPGKAVYVDLTPVGLPAIRPGDPRVHIYENRLCLPRRFPVEDVVYFKDNHAVIEALRWNADKYDLTRQALVAPSGWPGHEAVFISENGEAFDFLVGRKYTCRQANGLGAVTRGGVVCREARFDWPAYLLGVFPVQGLALAIYLLATFILPRRLNRLRRGTV